MRNLRSRSAWYASTQEYIGKESRDAIEATNDGV